MKREIAEYIVSVVNSCASQLVGTLQLVEDNVPSDEYKIYKRVIAKVMNMMDLEILEQVAREYPDLLPWGDMKKPGQSATKE